MEDNHAFATLKKLTEIGAALSAERDKQKLLERILEGAKELTYADGGTLYTVTSDGKLRFEIVRTSSLKISWERVSGQESKFHDISLKDSDGKTNDNNIVAYAVNHDKTINIDDAYQAEGFDFSGTKRFDESTGYRSKSFLTVPMKNHEDDIIGVLQLINSIDQTTGEIKPFTTEDKEIVESLASQAAIAMTNQKLIQELKVMFESLVHVLAGAIDEKSPVTGKHCKRVPIISDLIAKAVNDTTDGPLKESRFSETELYELNIAALLHDCGKVTTPVHVVEKGKKLETIIDRIELINLRFEILRRDAIIAHLQRLLKKHNIEPSEDDDLKKILATLTEERQFIKESNLGKESMSDEHLKKIQEIAAKKWLDQFGKEEPLITEDEIKNLSIFKGTLTTEERLVIQNHVVMTIKMLSEIPYPKHLREVPEIAGKHHERIDGKGYPNGLTGKEMSLRARILAVADVFEALTAPDRPYKEVMTLAKAIKILNSMKDEGHIDPDVWQVFLDKKVYLTYGREYLRPEQLDYE